MSQTGALIESAELPVVGCAIALRRGQLQADGFVVWLAGTKAGIRFKSPAFVSDWMARQNVGQGQVDDLVSSLKDSALARVRLTSSVPSTESELMRLRDDLASLGSALALDIVVTATHPEIQLLDISIQRIDRILGRLRAEG